MKFRFSDRRVHKEAFRLPYLLDLFSIAPVTKWDFWLGSAVQWLGSDIVWSPTNEYNSYAERGEELPPLSRVMGIKGANITLVFSSTPWLQGFVPTSVNVSRDCCDGSSVASTCQWISNCELASISNLTPEHSVFYRLHFAFTWWCSHQHVFGMNWSTSTREMFVFGNPIFYKLQHTVSQPN